jgi:hypothetical protein
LSLVVRSSRFALADNAQKIYGSLMLPKAQRSAALGSFLFMSIDWEFGKKVNISK